MTNEPLVWHYGLMAERWAECITDAPEASYFERAIDTNPLEQSYTRQVRLEKRVAGQVVTTETYTLHGNMYLKNEVLLMLRVAGFSEITVHGDYSDEPATLEHDDLIFTAVRS